MYCNGNNCFKKKICQHHINFLRYKEKNFNREPSHKDGSNTCDDYEQTEFIGN